MENDTRKLRRFEVLKAIESSPAWLTLRDEIQKSRSDRSVIDQLVADIADAIEKVDEIKYLKRTFQIEESLLEEMQVYCVKNNITQKTFINLAIQMMLDVSE